MHSQSFEKIRVAVGYAEAKKVVIINPIKISNKKFQLPCMYSFFPSPSVREEGKPYLQVKMSGSKPYEKMESYLLSL